MKKLVITLVIASLHTVAFAQKGGKAARAAEEGAAALKGKERIQPGKATGTKVNAREAGETTQSAGQAQRQNDIAARQELKQAQAGGTCDINGPVAKVSKRQQAALASAYGKGIGGSACANSFESPETVGVVADGVIAGEEKLASFGLSDVSQASIAQKIEIRNAMEGGYARALGVSAEEADQRFDNMCKNGCDHASAALCAVN